METAEILKQLKEEDIPADNMAVYEYFNDLDDSVLDDFPWFVSGDNPGLNWYRFMLANFNGLNFSFCRYSLFKKLSKRYIAEREERNKHKLAKDLGVSEKTIRRYLGEMRKAEK